MAWPRGLVALAGVAVAAALGVVTSPAEAQEAAVSGRFGQRDAFVFSVERIFGFVNQELSEDGGSFETKGLQPLFWGGVGLFSMSPSGLNFGALLGATRITLEDDDGDKLTFNFIQLRPRIGYAGTEKEGRFGYWVRGGPNGVLQFTSGDGAEDNSDAAFGLGFEAYAVFFPAPHVGIVAGPHADFHLARTGDNEDFEYRSYGLTFGIMGEFY